ncbi:YtxH domain-containing protein [Streptomyces gobiensis]|uniref:YtxH domain-containing protein n=1 Tax=Streptomyces gobiensis TaxID=2875706 RepID=UPI001E5C7252|nr:YtxH domain-containing protein [Streptomyces gobiensis]UGY91304.1 YtxH domain-containing protein [Streptomyces gobiensis]
MRHRWAFITGLAVGYVVGTRAGRERYEQLRRNAEEFVQNPAVRNTVESAAQTGRQAAARAAHVVTDKVGDRLPDPVAEKVRALCEPGRRPSPDENADWGVSNT